MYRLVNVPVNPSGRFGAPATEPGPSGMAGEFMRVSLDVLRLAGGRGKVRLRLAGQEVLPVGVRSKCSPISRDKSSSVLRGR